MYADYTIAKIYSDIRVLRVDDVHVRFNISVDVPGCPGCR